MTRSSDFPIDIGLFELESELRRTGALHIAGIDEVGRGALAGPLTVCAIVLEPESHIDGLNDSKLLRPAKRMEISHELRSVCSSYAIVHISAAEIDSTGLARALKRAARSALSELSCECDHVLTDGHPLGIHKFERGIISGDRRVAAIAAASVIAKVARDSIMDGAHDLYPEYDFLNNKGYGTKNHLRAIATHGLTPLHRRSFGPCSGQLKILDRCQ